MRRLVFATAVILLLTVSASAQEETPKVEVFGGYSYGGSNAHGWNGSVAGNVNRWLGVVADFGGQYTRIESPASSERIKTHSLLFGPRLSARTKHVTPFAHVLVGAAHNDARAREEGFDFHFTDTSFAVAVGGGLDVRVSERVAVRAFQLDYLRTNFFGGTQNNGRISAGIVFRFGKK
ncbi:MAG: porin family protein [Rubrivivax sp.]|nr:porin family protein [Pyrinomonadaceae bacterium]